MSERTHLFLHEWIVFLRSKINFNSIFFQIHKCEGFNYLKIEEIPIS